MSIVIDRIVCTYVGQDAAFESMAEGLHILLARL